MARGLAGFKVRSLRREAGIAQGELARRAGISPSYLNLIERNKRPVAGGLLDRIAAGLGVERAELDGQAERRVVESLNEAVADSAVNGGLTHPGGTEELVGRHPGWAELVLKLYQGYREQSQVVLALADRLNRDPFLGESVHRMLTSVTSVRSAAEILEGADSLAPEDSRRFLSIIASDSARTAETAQALVGYFESAQVRVRSATPMESVDAFVLESDNHFPGLEACASEFRAALAPGQAPEAAAAAILERGMGEENGGQAIAGRGEQRFECVRRAAGDFAREAVGDLVDNHTALLPTEEARGLAANALFAYVAGAVLMPYEAFLEAAEAARYNVDVLAQLFGVSYEQAAHRLATLRRPGAEGVRFAFMRSDPSGYVTKRLPLPDLPLPRYGTACPLWVVYVAFQSPGATVRNLGELPQGERFLFFARALDKAPPTVGLPRRLLSVMLACSADDADRVVYADGLERNRAVVPMGTVCRLCPREGCRHRQEAPLIA